MSLPSTNSLHDTPVENRHQLVAYLEAGNKPREHWLIGTEHERHSFRRDDLRPVPYEGERGIRAVLEMLAQRFGYSPILERGLPIALEKAKTSITLEPGGQIELAG